MDTPAGELDELLTSVAGGDQKAFKTLYQTSAPKLLAIAQRILKDRGLAEDVLQDVYVKIWKDADRFDRHRGRAMAWMTIIARNKSIDMLRSLRRRPVQVDDTAETPLIERLPQPKPGADTVDRIALYRCIDELSPEHRNLILAAYFEGHTREELAQRFGSPVGTIKTRIRAALANLRTCMGAIEEP